MRGVGGTPLSDRLRVPILSYEFIIVSYITFRRVSIWGNGYVVNRNGNMRQKAQRIRLRIACVRLAVWLYHHG